MTTLAPPNGDFAVLDQQILDALRNLRTARAATGRRRDRRDRELQVRAEEHLNALLEYRHAAQGR